MHAVALFDFRLSERAFWRLSLGQFWALWERHKVAFKRFLYAAGVPAAATLNSRRTDPSQHIFSPMDFVPRPADDCRHDEIILMLREQMYELEPEQYAVARKTWTETLTAKGLDAEEILLEVFEGLG